MKLTTKCKRPGWDAEIDVYYERIEGGFSEHINDKTTYKMVVVDTGSFVLEEDGKYRVISAPAALALNEKAEFKVVSASNIISRTLYVKPTLIRDEFTIDAINEGKFDQFICKVEGRENLSGEEQLTKAITGNISFDESFSKSMVYQDALLLLRFWQPDHNITVYELTMQEYHTLRRLCISIDYEIHEQPDNFWILRTRYFIQAILFMGVADFYHNYRQDDLYESPLVAKVTRYFFENISKEITLSDVLERFSVNKNQLNAAFNKEVEMSCMAHLEQLRMTLAKSLMQDDDASISDISLVCGYADTNYFAKVFKKYYGMTPSDYYKQLPERSTSMFGSPVQNLLKMQEESC